MEFTNQNFQSMISPVRFPGIGNNQTEGWFARSNVGKSIMKRSWCPDEKADEGGKRRMVETERSGFDGNGRSFEKGHRHTSPSNSSRFDEMTGRPIQSGCGKRVNKDRSVGDCTLESDEDGSEVSGEKRRREEEGLVACPGLNLVFPRGNEEIVIPNNEKSNEMCDDVSKMYLDLSEFKRLKTMIIGNNCFKHVYGFILNRLNNLESVEIGGYCFSCSDEDEGVENGKMEVEDDDDEEEDGCGCGKVCQITNCLKLHTLVIKTSSFEYFHQLVLLNVNSLQSIHFGDNCFANAEECILKGE